MDIRAYITKLGFTAKDGTTGIFQKIYAANRNYVISVDLEKGHIDYGEKIAAGSRTTQNFFQPENFVVLECVDRLLRKGYPPQNIVLEKTWRSGHGTSGRLDICVNRDDGSPYLLIECKTYGREFQRELSNIHTDGGQLFTYFQLSGCKADLLMLYTSELRGGSFVYENDIIKIEDDYRGGDVVDIYGKWNKLTKDNGVFEEGVQPYKYQSKALTPEKLKEITFEDSSFIFNRFLEILRHNVVSDKGNAFNKIFTLFLCKVYDETTTRNGEELKFQWLEGSDDHVKFQLRLTDLYAKGMKKFLEREVSDFDKADFDNRCKTLNDETKQYLLNEVIKLRLEKNNEFAIKEVYDHDSFVDNAKVVKEVVELIQGYRIRYNKRQQYLSDFFELLLTTGLKQEAGQFFTPIPVAQFIIRSLPLDKIIKESLSRTEGDILPYMIDYAAGSGHFITEYMNEVQSLIDTCDETQYIDETQRRIKNWRTDNFDWATRYVYGIEKDYRLVKVGKVGCYLHGDGLANVMLSDGLANFRNNKDYKGKLHKSADDGTKDNQQFDILLSNPPYSVSSFRRTTRNYYTENDFDLYDALTDNSSEIECLFIERAKQLLKKGGMAGIILPSSILSNTGIYTKAREMILKYFDLVAVAELGSNTFMATNTNTVVLFLRRRDNYFAGNTKDAVDKYFRTFDDVTINSIETPAAKYVAHVWNGLDYSDYVTLLRRCPNEKVKAHNIFTGYKKKYSNKTESVFWKTVLNIEAEKLLYFIMAYPQQVVLVKSGNRETEKRFLGYVFSKHKGNEGIHAIQRGEDIDKCTQMFDLERYENPDKASTYVYQAFCGDFSSQISESMQQHVSRANLIDLLAFDNDSFEKAISLTAKKKVTYKGNWKQVRLGDVATIQAGNSAPQNQKFYENGKYPFFRTSDVAKEHHCYNLTVSQNLLNESGIKGLRLFKKDSILFPKSGVSTYLDHRALMGVDGYVVSHLAVITVKDTNIVNPKYLYEISKLIKAQDIKPRSGYPSLNEDDIKGVKIPLPPKDIQDKIVAEINAIEDNVALSKSRIVKLENDIEGVLSSVVDETQSINVIAPFVTKSIKLNDISIDTYVTTDNMRQNKLGIIPFDSVANISSITEYKKNDILISNIRPYLKKIWFADKDGGCSKDVLVLRSSAPDKYNPKYIYYMLQRDAFFDFVMKSTKGIKMPRGNKTEIGKYEIPVPTIEQQRNILSRIDKLELEIFNAKTVISQAPQLKQAVLDRYL